MIAQTTLYEMSRVEATMLNHVHNLTSFSVTLLSVGVDDPYRNRS